MSKSLSSELVARPASPVLGGEIVTGPLGGGGGEVTGAEDGGGTEVAPQVTLTAVVPWAAPALARMFTVPDEVLAGL